MSFEQVVLLIQVVGIPLVGWAIRELRRLIKSVNERFTQIEKRQDENAKRIQKLEKALPGAA